MLPSPELISTPDIGHTGMSTARGTPVCLESVHAKPFNGIWPFFEAVPTQHVGDEQFQQVPPKPVSPKTESHSPNMNDAMCRAVESLRSQQNSR